MSFKIYAKLLWLFLSIFLITFHGSANARSNIKRLNINLVVHDNFVGRGKDRNILMDELKRLGHNVKWICPRAVKKSKEQNIPCADVNIFIEEIWDNFLPYASKNYFMPNPECGNFNETDINEKFDLILCRTHDGMNIYSPCHPNPSLLKFTSEDHYNENVVKDFYKPLHAIGKSAYKGTATVLNVWEKRNDIPKLTYMQGKDQYHPDSENIYMSDRLIVQDEFIRIQNEHGLHICPSQAEGFGHYIIEAMSTGAVVITTDAPPMNEYITDKRFLVRTKGYKEKNMGYVYEIDEEHLEEVIERTLNMDENELREVGRRNRAFFLNMREEFRERLEDLFGKGALRWNPMQKKATCK